jgi:nucleotide-binding universal stress UspA family protein
LFAATILVIGLILRGLAAERAERRATGVPAINRSKKAELPLPFEQPVRETTGPAMLCAVRGIGRTLDFAIQEAKDTDRPLYILFIREQPVIAPEDRKRKWIEDDEARAIFTYAKDKASGHRLLPAYAISDSPADTIVDIAATVGASYLIVGAPQRNALVNLLRGNIIRNISNILPEEIHLLVYA